MGVASLITPSAGDQLAQQQLRRVSRRHQGGSNWRKVVEVLTRQCKDVLDKLVHWLSHNSDLMAVEEEPGEDSGCGLGGFQDEAPRQSGGG